MDKEKLLFFLYRFLGILGNKLGLFHLYFISRVYGYLYYRIRPSGIYKIPLNGYELYVDSHDMGIVPSLLRGDFEKNETELFKSIIKPGMTIIDIGANVGYYTLLASRLAGPNGRVYAFEPEPNNYALLKRNIKAADIKMP